MPLDIQYFLSLSDTDKKAYKDKLIQDLQDAQYDWGIADAKVRNAMADDSIKPSEINPLLNYRSELQQSINRLTQELEVINRFQEGKDKGDLQPTSAPGFGGGIVNIRADDNKNRAIPKAKTYSELVSQEKDKKGNLDEAITKIDAFLKMVESLKKEEITKQATQIS